MQSKLIRSCPDCGTKHVCSSQASLSLPLEMHPSWKRLGRYMRSVMDDHWQQKHAGRRWSASGDNTERTGYRDLTVSAFCRYGDSRWRWLDVDCYAIALSVVTVSSSSKLVAQRARRSLRPNSTPERPAPSPLRSYIGVMTLITSGRCSGRSNIAPTGRVSATAMIRA